VSRSIKPFVTARQLTGCPVTAHYKEEGIHGYQDEGDEGEQVVYSVGC
jgi:hypothetical protein